MSIARYPNGDMYCIIMYNFIVWCIIEHVNDSGPPGEHVVSSKHLELESGDPLAKKDLYVDNKVLWRWKGKVYEVAICNISSK